MEHFSGPIVDGVHVVEVVAPVSIRIDAYGEAWTKGFCVACLFGPLEQVRLSNGTTDWRCVDCEVLQYVGWAIRVLNKALFDLAR